MTAAPRAERLAVPSEYGSPSQLLDWATVDARLGEAEHYWLATVRPDGRPHVVPLDGLWLEGRWWFGGSPGAVKHRNLLAEPRASLHLDDAVAAVIVEGSCAIVTPSQEWAEHLAASSKAKYGYGPPASVYLGGVWALAPAKVMAWSDLSVDPTRFVFEG